MVHPGELPESWPTCTSESDPVDAIPGCITSELSRIWHRQLGEDWLIAEAGGRVHEDENSAYDLDIMGIVQACIGPVSPVIDRLSSQGIQRTIHWGSERFITFGGSYDREPADNSQETHADWLVWRLAAPADPRTVSRWQWWRTQRRVWLPSPILARESFNFRCSQDSVTVYEDGYEVARWIDWAHKMRELNMGDLTPSTGQMLLIRRSLIEREAAKLGGVFAWICKITTYHRKHMYREFTETHFMLDFGTTKIVRM
jgi:hypothetical protein